MPLRERPKVQAMPRKAELDEVERTHLVVLAGPGHGTEPRLCGALVGTGASAVALVGGEVSGGADMHFLVSVAGIVLMSGLAWVISWYKHSADKGASRNKSTGGGNADLAGGSV